jgi:hypothetical protein
MTGASGRLPTSDTVEALPPENVNYEHIRTLRLAFLSARLRSSAPCEDRQPARCLLSFFRRKVRQVLARTGHC